MRQAIRPLRLLLLALLASSVVAEPVEVWSGGWQGRMLVVRPKNGSGRLLRLAQSSVREDEGA